ncbi:MAG: hypothetical protein ACTHON_18320 [Humibacter sp.]
MEQNTETPAVIYTAMHGMKPRSGQISATEACGRITSALLLDGLAFSRVIKRRADYQVITVVAVATPTGHVTGVYEFPAGIR